MSMLNGPDGKNLEARLRRLDDVSWNFDGARSRSPVSATHFHPARFISQLPSILIALLTEPGATVLDPFCGSGTTLVEAQRLSRRAIGFDINPVSVMMSRAKTLGLDAASAAELLQGFAGAIADQDPAFLRTVPETVQLRKWYTPPVALALAALHHDIRVTTDSDAGLLKTFCFSSILLRVCRETRHWGYVCDNTMPKDEPERNVPDILDRAIHDILDGFATRPERAPPVAVHQRKAVDVGEEVQANSIDLVITSPPYFGVVDYVKSQRLSLEWLGYDVETHRRMETGARSKRHRRLAESDFEQELEQSFQAIFRCMKPGTACCVVFGTSPSRGFSFERLLALLERIGLRIWGDHARDVSVQRTLKPSVLTERLILLTKPTA